MNWSILWKTNPSFSEKQMIEFTYEQQKLIFDAVRHYQMNHIGSQAHYDKCQTLLNSMDIKVKHLYGDYECDI